MDKNKDAGELVLVDEVEALLAMDARRDIDLWETFISKVPELCILLRQQHKRIQDHEHWLDGLRAAWDIPKGTTIHEYMKSMALERDELRERLRIVQSADDGNLDAKAQALADLFAGKNVDGCIATEAEIDAVRKTLSLRAKERQTASERIAELTNVLERVRDLDSLNDLLDLMPTIVKAIGPSPALLTRPPPPTQP